MVHDRRVWMRGLAPALLAVVLASALTACDPAEAPVAEPTSTPSATATESEAPEPSPEPEGLSIPAACDELLSEATLANFAAAGFEHLPEMLDDNPLAQEFGDRGGLACGWGIPQSEAMTLVFVAPLQIDEDQWAGELDALGFVDGPDFLDECRVKVENSEVGDFVTTRTLVEGFEIYAFGNGADTDAYLSLTREVSDSMGYL